MCSKPRGMFERLLALAAVVSFVAFAIAGYVAQRDAGLLARESVPASQVTGMLPR